MSKDQDNLRSSSNFTVSQRIKEIVNTGINVEERMNQLLSDIDKENELAALFYDECDEQNDATMAYLREDMLSDDLMDDDDHFYTAVFGDTTPYAENERQSEIEESSVEDAVVTDLDKTLYKNLQ